MPETVRLEIPSIRDKQTDFNKLFQLHQIVEERLTNPENIDKFLYDFSRCRTIFPNGIAFLYGLFRYIQSKQKKLFYVGGSIKKDIETTLIYNGFLRKIDEQAPFSDDSSIILRQDLSDNSSDNNSIIDHLKNNWLNKKWIHLSDNVRNAIAGTMWEVYDNAFHHANSSIGVFSCGQKISDKVKLAVIDFGRGIPLNVRQFKGDSKMSSSKALKWAFKEGNTTIAGNRGMGLNILKSFVRLNKGELEIFSGTGHAKINETTELFTSKKVCFDGTLTYMTFMSDDKYYHFAGEPIPLPPEPLF
jgi:hypothetical protein